MAESKKTAVKTAEAKAEEKAPVITEVTVEGPQGEEVKAPVKRSYTKRGTAKKETAKNDTVKKTPGRKPGSGKKATTKTTTRKTTVSEVVNFEFSEKSYTPDDLVKIAKDVWRYDLKMKIADLKSINLYVKPEESLAYYVINGDVSGSFRI